ncbi:MAG: PTS transporter subunit EIIC [Candidatus Asgardarchaeia archaeon]
MSSALDRFGNYLEEKLYPVAAKFGANRYITAIRDGYISIVPLLIVGAVFLILAFLPVPEWEQFLTETGWFGKLLAPVTLTYGLMAFWGTFNIAASLARYYREYGLDPVYTAMASTTGFLLVSAPGLATDYLGGQGMFVATIFPLVAVEIIRFTYQYGIYPRLPERVPPFITNMFKTLTGFTFVVFLAWIIGPVPEINLSEAILYALRPTFQIVDTPEMMTFENVLTAFLWTFAIHPAVPIYGIFGPFTAAFLEENAEAFASGMEPPHVFVMGFDALWQCAGGTGNHLSLIVVALLPWKV